MSRRRLFLAVLVNGCSMAAFVLVRDEVRILVLCFGVGFFFATIVGPFLPRREVTEADIDRLRSLPIVGPLFRLGFWWMGDRRGM